MIEVETITKRFGHRVVLDRLDLSVRDGELFAVLGPNGSGKTTLLKCLVGLYVPVEGRIAIAGLDRRRDHLAIRRFTAWLADQPYLYPQFTGRDWLRMVADLYGIETSRRERQIEALVASFHLTAIADEPIAYYSNGEYKKTAICGALAANARLLLLDEPFAGEIDPPGAAALKEILRRMARRGTTTVFTTQIVDQAERLADRVGILHQGRLDHVGTPAELRRRHGVDSLEEALTAITRPDWRGSTESFLDAVGDGGGP